MLVLGEHDVRRLLDMESCIEAMTEVLTALARGELFQPLRSMARPPGANGLIGLMPAHRSGENAAWSLKEIVVVPSNPTRGLDAHQGWRAPPRRGDGTARRAAECVPGDRDPDRSRLRRSQPAHSPALTPRESRSSAPGVQARSHVAAMRAVLDDPGDPDLGAQPRRRRAARRRGRRPSLRRRSDAALFGAEVVCTTTSATEPIVELRWLAEGAHVNAVGSSIPTTRELDTATVAAATFFVDRRESTLNESGDYLLAAAEGAIGPEHIAAELGDVLTGSHPGRRSETELTVFKSLGIAVEDLAAAELVVRRAREQGVGTEVEF